MPSDSRPRASADPPPVRDPASPPPPAPDLRARPIASPGDRATTAHPAPPGADPVAATTDDATFALDTPDSAPHRLPLRSLVSGTNPLQLVYLIPVIAPLWENSPVLALSIAAGLFVLVQAIRVVGWSRFRWGFDGQVLRVESGVLWRNLRALDVDRIQQVEVQQPLLHQALGTAVVNVETASDSGDTEVALAGIDHAVGTALRTAVLAARRRTPRPGDVATPDHDGTATVEASSVRLLKPSVVDLVRSAVTGSSLLVVPVSMVALSEFVFDLFGDDIGDAASEAAQVGARIGVVAGALIVLVVGVVGAIVTTLLRDWDIELVREGDDLRLSRGLLDKRTSTIPLQRLQVVQYRQNWIRRFFGTGTLRLRSAGGTGGNPSQGQSGSNHAAIPWVHEDDARRIVESALAGALHDQAVLPDDVQRHPRAARRRLVWKWVRLVAVLFVPIAGGAMYVVGNTAMAGRAVTALVVAAALMGLAWLGGNAEYRRLGHAATDRVVLVTGGILGHTRDWMPLGRLQGVQARANIFQRRLDLVTIQLAPAGSGNLPVAVSDVSTATATQLGRRFTRIAAGRASPVPAPAGPSSPPQPGRPARPGPAAPGPAAPGTASPPPAPPGPAVPGPGT